MMPRIDFLPLLILQGEHFFFIGIIVILIIYIVFLQLQLSKRNIFLNSIFSAIKRSGKNWDKEDVLKLITKLQQSEPAKKVKKDYMLDEYIQQFIFNNHKFENIFIHYTNGKEVAENILHNGFVFEESFHKTAEDIYNDRVNFSYKHNLRKHYGKYVIIIAIDKVLYAKYTEELNKYAHVDYSTEHVLSTNIETDREEESEFHLPPQFIKGYVNYENGEIVKNPLYKPSYDDPIFQENLKLLAKNKTL